jgi:hypothetical protein
MRNSTKLTSPRRRDLLAAGTCAALLSSCSLVRSATTDCLGQGVVWQLNNDGLDSRGD